MDIKEFDTVLVEWVDSTGDDGNWTNFGELEEFKLSEVFTAGFLIKETDEALYIALSVDTVNDGYCSVIAVPKVAVKSMVVLRRVKPKSI